MQAQAGLGAGGVPQPALTAASHGGVLGSASKGEPPAGREGEGPRILREAVR